MVEVNPVLQKIRKIKENFGMWQQKHPEATKEEYFSMKNNSAMKIWTILKENGFVISNWRPF